MTPIRIDMAVVDPDTGDTDKVFRISLPDGLLDLEATDWPDGCSFEERSGSIVIGGREWPTTGSAHGVGNALWNSYEMELSIAVEFICWLHDSRLFTVDSGEQRLFNLWRWREPLPAEFVERQLAQAALAEQRP